MSIPEPNEVDSASPPLDDEDGILLPSPEPSKLERRSARLRELELLHQANPDANAQMAHREKYKRIKKSTGRPRSTPKDSKVYKTIMAYLAMRAHGMPRSEAAAALGIKTDTLTHYLYRGRQKGWVNRESFLDPTEGLDVILAGKAVRNLELLLDDKDSCAGDKEITLEVAKGLGMLKTHQVVKGDIAAPVAIGLQVQIEMPQGQPPAALELRPGSIGGSGLFIEGEVANGPRVQKLQSGS